MLASNSAVEDMIDHIIKLEGGFSNHPDDRGGATKYGVTQATLTRYYGYAASIDDVQKLSIDVAKEIYKKFYFYGPGIHTLPGEYQSFFFDSAVNHGPRRSIKFCQNVCNDAQYRPALKVDGAVGPNTRKAVKWAKRVMQGIFIDALYEERRNFYRTIVISDPSQDVFYKGWMNRLDSLKQESQR